MLSLVRYRNEDSKRNSISPHTGVLLSLYQNASKQGKQTQLKLPRSEWYGCVRARCTGQVAELVLALSLLTSSFERGFKATTRTPNVAIRWVCFLICDTKCPLRLLVNFTSGKPNHNNTNNANTNANPNVIHTRLTHGLNRTVGDSLQNVCQITRILLQVKLEIMRDVRRRSHRKSPGANKLNLGTQCRRPGV